MKTSLEQKTIKTLNVIIQRKQKHENNELNFCSKMKTIYVIMEIFAQYRK